VIPPYYSLLYMLDSYNSTDIVVVPSGVVPSM
jgi:hypothetical protein